ncbi:MAG: phosphoribosylformylglycinamidine synthase [Deltaproteobacteria bacterium]|nr:phosphoribosylformylglycinamidine synthase [Deltaproteobacteria bacterium]
MALHPSAHFVAVFVRPGQRDVAGERVRAEAGHLGLHTGNVRVGRIYAVDLPGSAAGLTRAAPLVLADAVLETVAVDALPAHSGAFVLTARLPGVTDDEGRTAQWALQLAWDDRRLGDGQQRVFAQRLVLCERPLADDELRQLAAALGNPLVDRLAWGRGAPEAILAPAFVDQAPAPQQTVDLNRDDAGLVTLSKQRTWHLDAAELRAIRDHFTLVAADRVGRGMPAAPTDCEIEVFAQTWSEHCKHKEFNATITFRHNGQVRTVRSLFKTFIRGATETIRAKYAAIGQDWMVTVFSDNAGLVELDADHYFALKVETHNSPSALDPVGGAMTGVLGNNRDAFGTGKGGARLLFNTDVLCFGTPDYAKPLLRGQLHPLRVARGVVDGVEQAGNKSGVPTVNGAVLFDDRFAGKPLVYCGTGALLPKRYANGRSEHKDIRPGDRIVVIGGRVGRDGIHGATFSSGALDDQVSGSVVQIGSPFVQKLASDLLTEACLAGLVAGCTDNGAGGLSSSVGELAQGPGGAWLQLDRVPLKYAGLQPWEILLSESQERMTLAVRPADVPALLALAARRSVEATDIGAFDDSGRLVVRHGATTLADLDLGFLHEGVPTRHMEAVWDDRPALPNPAISLDTGAMLLRLLASANICSREAVVRLFDHEVKGKTVVKPLMGPTGLAPQDAAVVRAGFDGWHGLAVASGICPKFGDLDPYAMAAGAFDEAVRSLVSVGARLPVPGEAPSWSGCDNFCVPNSAFDPVANPDGRQKLGKLVRMCEALYDCAVFFDVPMTSGKDSMKNDFVSEGHKISVPPTVLFTLVARLPDVRRAVTSEWKAAGDVVYQVGATYDELGGAEWSRLCCGSENALRGGPADALRGAVPQVRLADARRVYEKVMAAHAAGWLASSHDLSDGGLAVALAECAIGSGFGAQIDVCQLTNDASLPAVLFGESHSRLVVSVAPEHTAAFEAVFGADAVRLGVVTQSAQLTVQCGAERLCALTVADLSAAWRTPLW